MAARYHDMGSDELNIGITDTEPAAHSTLSQSQC